MNIVVTESNEWPSATFTIPYYVVVVEATKDPKYDPIKRQVGQIRLYTLPPEGSIIRIGEEKFTVMASDLMADNDRVLLWVKPILPRGPRKAIVPQIY